MNTSGWAAFSAAVLSFFTVEIAQPDAASFDDHILPDHISALDQKLILSGCGVREMMWFELYLLGLYLPRPVSDADAIRSPEMAKAIRLEVVYDGSLPESLPSLWRDPIRDEIAQDFFRVLQDLYTEIKTGDVIVFTYRPDRGNSVVVNGKPVASRANDNLIDTLLDLWIGARPVSKNLRRLLLNGSC